MGQLLYVSCGFLKEVEKEDAKLWATAQNGNYCPSVFYDVSTLLLQLKDTFINRERFGFDLHPL